MTNYVGNYKADDETLMIRQHATGESFLKCLDCHEQKINEQMAGEINWLMGNYTFPIRTARVWDPGFLLISRLPRRSRDYRSNKRP